MRVKLTTLPIEANNSASAIKAVFATMPREDQSALLATLQPKTARLRWLEPPAAAKVVAVLDDLDPDSRALIEIRLLPPWMRQVRRQTERDAAIRATAWLYVY